jgi:hypothetical protein
MKNNQRGREDVVKMNNQKKGGAMKNNHQGRRIK